ncbi:glycosyl transferase, group 1 family protein [Chondrocystis sp. NIES-4102]|nr:glycosyl transferase, group 1 family protein [Chondrocystis sp. NIES-4102]
MKIAYLVNQYPAISHSFIRREIIALETFGIKVERFSIRNTSELVDQADKLECNKTRFILKAGSKSLLSNLLITAITRPRRFWQTLKLTHKIGWGQDRGFLIHLAYLAEACLLLRWTKEADIAHIHAHFAFNPTTVAMLCHTLGGPTYSFTVHGPESIDRAIILALGEKIKRATFVAAISSYCQSQLYRWCDRADWSKIQIIHCGLDQPFFADPPTPVPQNSRFVCVARLSEQKGHFVLLAAASQLAQAGWQFKLNLVGDGPLRPQIEAMIVEYGLQKYVELTGWLSNSQVRQQIIDAQIMVLPSFAEGLPVVIMEALALGRPVISTYIAGIPELLENDVCGWLVPSGSVAALTNAMRRALELSPQQLEQMSEIGVERVKQQHNVLIEAQKLANLFQQTAEGSVVQAAIPMFNPNNQAKTIYIASES